VVCPIWTTCVRTAQSAHVNVAPTTASMMDANVSHGLPTQRPPTTGPLREQARGGGAGFSSRSPESFAGGADGPTTGRPFRLIPGGVVALLLGSRRFTECRHVPVFERGAILRRSAGKGACPRPLAAGAACRGGAVADSVAKKALHLGSNESAALSEVLG
jgi:hypothetical protein